MNSLGASPRATIPFHCGISLAPLLSATIPHSPHRAHYDFTLAGVSYLAATAAGRKIVSRKADAELRHKMARAKNRDISVSQRRVSRPKLVADISHRYPERCIGVTISFG